MKNQPSVIVTIYLKVCAFDSRRLHFCKLFWILENETDLYAISQKWNQQHQQYPKNLPLSKSKFKFTQKDRDYITTKGFKTIKEHAFQFIKSRFAPAFPKNEGKQTPLRGHLVFIAQHAPTTCCRGCLWKWQRSGKGKPLTDDEIGFVVGLVMGWICCHTPQYSPCS